MNLGSRNSQHNFAKAPQVQNARSSFDRSFTVKDTVDFDYLVPIYTDEILPGDTHNVKVNSFIRLATQEVPIMDNMYIDFFFFFVPNRLVWNNWERFNGAQDDPDDSTDYMLPIITFTSAISIGSVYDHFGLPTGLAGGFVLFNALPIRCYPLIYNEWFRDQNLQNSIIVNKDDGPDAPGDVTLLKSNKRHDYFTSALPWPQKGPEVSLPLGTAAPVLNSNASSPQTFTSVTGLQQQTLRVQNASATPAWSTTGTALSDVRLGNTAGVTGLYADLATATSATINDLRSAMMVQSLYELDARGGTRYVEILKAHFGVTSPDFRLQRPEYLGGGTIRINSHPVAQTSQTDSDSPQANLAAFATASSTSRDGIGFSKSFVEHGYVIGLMRARADITYQQGINRMWNRSTRFDFFWPKLQLAGEQEIENREIYVQGNPNDYAVFGYQERYAEYRYKPSEIRGQFRSTAAQPLDMWHLAEEFNALPALNNTFIQSSTPIERAIAVDTEPDLLCDLYFEVKSARPMVAYPVPATLGRF